MTDTEELDVLIAASSADDGLGLLVFAGAGASVEPPTSFPTSATLTATIVRALCSAHPLVADRSDDYVSLICPIRLELMLDILLERVGTEIMNCLRGFCRDARPNLTHQSVARLIKNVGKNSRIVTTNFDWMFERALLNERVDFKQTIAIPSIEFESQRAEGHEVIKLHGSVFNKDKSDTFHTLQAAIAQVGKPVLPEFRDQFLSLLRQHNILVIGYSGLDDFDLRDLWIEAGKEALGRLLWIHHSGAGDPTAQAQQIVEAWDGSGQLVQAHTSTLLCRAASIKWKNCQLENTRLDWFSDFVFDPRIRDLALHGLVRLLIQVGTMVSSQPERLALAEEVDWLLERSRELESLQSERRRYWAIKDQASGLPDTERRHHLLRAAGVLSDFVVSNRADRVMPTFERAVGMRELAWGIKDLSAPGESWKERTQECHQIADLFRRSFELAEKDFDKFPLSPRIFEHYVHSVRDHAWGQLFIGETEAAIGILQQTLNDVCGPAHAALWHKERILDEVAHVEGDLARFLAMTNSWKDASEHYLSAADKYRSMGRLVGYWVCRGCSAAALNDEKGFKAACDELTTLQANQERERLIARREKWRKQRAENNDG